MTEGADALEHAGVGIGIVGRVDERARIDALLDGAATGSSGAVVVAGPPGIGKSALLDYAVEQAAPFRILRVAGVESETAFGYAGVHQLVGPILDNAGALADPQRDALDAALGRIEHLRFDPFVVALAVLSLLGAAARTQPVLAVVDDAQWLDDESATVIAFVARRLQAESVAMLVAIRDTSDRPIEFERLPRLNVDGVSATDARALVTSAAGGVLDDAVADHIVAASAGNPLALLELPKALTARQLRGAVPLPDPLPIGPHLSNVFTARLRALSGAAQTALLLAAVEQMGDPCLFRRAASALAGLAWDEAATEAEASGLVKFEPLVSFRHPLVRSAVYYASSPAQRRRVHAALATAWGSADDLDRLAWHLGAATIEPDEQVARALEAAAERGNAALRAIASDWRFSGIFNARSGSWLTITTGRDINGTGISGQRVNQVSDNPYGDRDSLLTYLNPAAFGYPAAGEYGNHKNNAFEGPGFWTADLAISRLVPVSTHSLELRVEVFNLFNNFNWGNPNTNLDAGTFGRITTQSGDPRIMQFGVKYGF